MDVFVLVMVLSLMFAFPLGVAGVGIAALVVFVYCMVRCSMLQKQIERDRAEFLEEFGYLPGE